MRRVLLSVSLVFVLGFVVGANAGQERRGAAKRQTPYFVGDFDTCNFSQWNLQGRQASFKIVHRPRVQGRCAAALTVGPWALNDIPNRQPSDGAALWLRPARYGTDGQTVWQHFSVQFAKGFRATSGEWNWFAEWHNDNGGPTLPREFANLCWTARNIQGITRIAMRIIGGSSARPRTIWVTGPRLHTGHWYDFRIRTIWSSNATAGFVQWWLDGKRLYSRHTATLYTRPDGSVSTVYFVLDNYRRHADWNATVAFDGTRLGPTRSSVRY